MVTIVRKKSKDATKDNYYVYDYIFDKKKGKLKRFYIGTADEKAYLHYKKLAVKPQIYCQVCGKRNKESMPKYLLRFNLLGCECNGK